MHTQILILTMLHTVPRSRLTDIDSLWDTRNVRSCGNLSLIKFRWCCVCSKGNPSQKGWFEEKSKCRGSFAAELGSTQADPKGMGSTQSRP